MYRIRDIDGAIATTVAGIVRSEIGKMELDQVQSNRSDLIERIRHAVLAMVDDWGIEVTRAEILDVNLDDATRAAMLQQLNAERARRAHVTEAEGKSAPSNWPLMRNYTNQNRLPKPAAFRPRPKPMPQQSWPKPFRKTVWPPRSTKWPLKQVEAMTTVGTGQGNQTIILPANIAEAFGNAFNMLKAKP